MIDPISEVNRLKHNLVMSGLTHDEAEQIGDLAMQDIDDIIFDLVSSYADEARNVVAALGGEQLAEEIQVIKRGPIFMIATESGETDFTRPEIQNLPNLLKNAKVAKDGSLYKVIPLDKKTGNNPTNIFDVYRDRNAEVRQQKLDRDARWDDVRTAKEISKRSLHFSGLAQAKRFLAKRNSANNTDNSVNSGEEKEFRTASSKQDPASDWVIPEKDMNISYILNDINNKLQHDVNSAIQAVVSEYGGLM